MTSSLEKQSIDFLSEIGRLLIWISDVATAIRMNSAYSNIHLQKAREPGKVNQIAHDVMWLSDALHNFSLLGKPHAMRQYPRDY